MALEDEAQEPVEPLAEAGQPRPELKVHSSRRSLAQVRRELSEEELHHPAVQRMMLDELERLDKEKEELLPYRDKFAEADRDCAVLKEKLKPKIAADIFFGSCTTVGAVLIGLSPTAWSVGVLGIAAVLLGVALIGAGIAAKVVMK